MRSVLNTALLSSFTAFSGCTTSSRGSSNVGSPMVAAGASLGEAGWKLLPVEVAVDGEAAAVGAAVVTGTERLVGADGSAGFALF
ncbi:hypothetical protein DVH05_009298 [Phytophthora capsici]|nr:hypothetical protein DVH05_009298 [Phytophthora capsici]